jgi:hypothetical protein
MKVTFSTMSYQLQQKWHVMELVKCSKFGLKLRRKKFVCTSPRSVLGLFQNQMPCAVTCVHTSLLNVEVPMLCNVLIKHHTYSKFINYNGNYDCEIHILISPVISKLIINIYRGLWFFYQVESGIWVLKYLYCCSSLFSEYLLPPSTL